MQDVENRLASLTTWLQNNAMAANCQPSEAAAADCPKDRYLSGDARAILAHGTELGL